MNWFHVVFETFQSEPKENVAADDDRQGGSDKSDDEVVPLEHGDEPDEEHAQGCDHNISGVSCS